MLLSPLTACGAVFTSASKPPIAVAGKVGWPGQVAASGQQRQGEEIQLLHQACRADISDLRQVPDNQEVFLSNDSDTAIIFEILQAVQDGGAASDMYEAAK